MRRFIFILLIFIGLSTGYSAFCQEYEVVSFDVVPNDLSARTKPRVDRIGRPCTIIKVYVPDKIVELRGSYIGDIDDHGMEKWIYVTDGCKEIELLFEKHYPLHVRFIDFNYVAVGNQMTYVMKLRESAGDHRNGSSGKQLGSSRHTPVSQPVPEPMPEPYTRTKLSENEIKDRLKEAYNSKDYATCISLIRQIPENREAQYYLAVCYARGNGISQNYEEAVKWYRKSVQQGYAPAMNNLGFCYKNGTGVTQDYGEAVKLYREAADKGNTAAMNNLGLCYENGTGVTQDYEEAVKWYREAADKGNATGMNNLGLCYENGTGLTQDYEEAVKWYRKAADKGNASAMYNLGSCYQNGRGVTQNYEEAVKWYRKAIEKGENSSMNNLGYCYENGYGVPKSYEEALKWYLKAAEKGSATSMYNVGVYYRDGKGVDKNIDLARAWFRQAADKGHEKASAALEKLK